MRALLLAVLSASFVSLAVPSGATAVSSHPDSDNAGTRLITVSSRTGGTTTERITLALGKAAVVQLDTDARDVLVSDPTTVDAMVRTPRRVFLLAQKIGQTNAFFFDGAGHQILTIDIRVERDLSDLTSTIRSDVPDSNIKVAALNDNVVLTGSVANAQDAARAQDLAAQFIRDPGKPIDATKIVNMLKISSNEQVMLKVRVAEMQRQIAKQFGINLAAATIQDGIPLVLSTSNPYGLAGKALSDLSGAQAGQVCSSASTVPGLNPLSALAGNGICNLQNSLQGQLQALEQAGLMHTLAEPNMTAVSGETAKFLAGGEFPVPAGVDNQGNVTIVFKQFGVGLSFTPVVLSDRRISLQLSTEVSELTNTGAYTLNPGTPESITIPALNVRRAETTVELPSGGSFAVAGLLQHTTKQVLDAFPGLKDMPVLGALFRSRDFESDETELVVIVSAYLVQPTNEKKFAAPTDGYKTASDMDTIAFGKLNAIKKPDPQGLKSAGQSKVGFIVE
jgi:pilus assembly protein CpaC